MPRQVQSFASQLDNLEQEIRRIERQLLAWHRQNAASQLLETISGIGLIMATALAASVPDPTVFKSGRQFPAYLGLVPRQNPSGGKDRLGHTSKMGNGYLRRLLVIGATSVTRRAPTIDSRTGTWVRSLLERKPTRVLSVAIANKTARAAWALLSKGESYRATPEF
ncbi:IS110 family transposase [Rhodobacteraceae bacterium Araon29]